MSSNHRIRMGIQPIIEPFSGGNIRQLNSSARSIAHQIQEPLQRIGISLDLDPARMGLKSLQNVLDSMNASIQQTNQGLQITVQNAEGLRRTLSLTHMGDGEFKLSGTSTSKNRLTSSQELTQAYNGLFAAMKKVQSLEKSGLVNTQAYQTAAKTLQDYQDNLQNVTGVLKRRHHLSLEHNEDLNKEMFAGQGQLAQIQEVMEYKRRQLELDHQATMSAQTERKRYQDDVQAIRQYVAAAKEELVQRQHLAQLEKTKGTTPEAIEGQRQIVNIAHQNTEALKQQAQNAEGFAEAQKQVDYATQKTNQKILEQNKTVEKSNGIFGNFKNTLKQVVQAGLSWKIFSAITQSLNDSIQTVIELDKSIVDLQIVMNSSREEAKKYLQTYSEMAQELGSTTKEVADSAVEWQRQGYSVNESNTLIKNSMILSKVGMVESAEATEYLTSAMKGYQLSVEDSMRVIDQLTAIDLEAVIYAVHIA